jgi:hypothetical protein
MLKEKKSLSIGEGAVAGTQKMQIPEKEQKHTSKEHS